MKYSIILVDLENKINIVDCYNYYYQNIYDNYEILYCTSQNMQVPSGVVNYVFESKNTEAIINTIVPLCSHNNIAVVRDCLQYKKVVDLVQNHTDNNQIVYLKTKQTKLSKIKLKIQKLIGKFFVHKIYNIDYSVILYGEITSKVLKNISYPSVLMKTNNWEGIDFVGVDGSGKYNFKYNKKKLAIKTLTPITLSLILIPLFFVIRPVTFRTIKVIYLLAILILLCIGAIYGAKWILSSVVGENITQKANIINKKGE